MLDDTNFVGSEFAAASSAKNCTGGLDAQAVNRFDSNTASVVMATDLPRCFSKLISTPLDQALRMLVEIVGEHTYRPGRLAHMQQRRLQAAVGGIGACVDDSGCRRGLVEFARRVSQAIHRVVYRLQRGCNLGTGLLHRLIEVQQRIFEMSDAIVELWRGDQLLYLLRDRAHVIADLSDGKLPCGLPDSRFTHFQGELSSNGLSRLPLTYVRFIFAEVARLSDTQPPIAESTLQDVTDAPTPNRIEDYAIIGNCESAALVGCDGSIDWLGLPRFDSAACFAALLGDPQHGRWLIAPIGAATRVTRRYRGNTLILETVFETSDGAVCVIDFMSRRDRVSDLVRLVKGISGTVSMRTELIVRFDYGSMVPWVSRENDGRLQFAAGPDRVLLDTTVGLRGENMRTVGEFDVVAGQEVAFSFSWVPSYHSRPAVLRAADALAQAEAFWSAWISTAQSPTEWSEAVLRSLLTLKSLVHRETGGIVAAVTTSLPEKLGGSRNWDYRYCWLRDATFTLYALIGGGFLDEAGAWRKWLLRAIGGSPDKLQIMYGVAGERGVAEYEIPWLPGYAGSAPVRIGNAAVGQLQLDVYGEVLDALYVARKAGLGRNAASWALECALVAHLETVWEQPDEGIWEVRGGRKHFTESKVMAWVAFDRAVRSAEEFKLNGPLEHWRTVRDAIHAQVCDRGFDPAQNSFIQSYGSTALDASLLLIPMVGFLPPTDPRIRGTLAAIEHNLVRDGLVLRYHSAEGSDGLPPGEGAFLACSFWLADNYVLQERYAEARALFDRLLSLRNDVGLLAEEYDAVSKRQLGNFPQAFSHLALINTARNLSGAGPVHDRSAKTGASSSSVGAPNTSADAQKKESAVNQSSSTQHSSRFGLSTPDYSRRVL